MFIFRFIGKLIKLVIKIVLIFAMVLVTITTASYVFVREKFDFDPYDAIKYAYVLGEDVDETSLCPNAFNSEDMMEVQALFNASVTDMITYTEENGYSISLENLSPMADEIKISDKQLGVLAQEIIEQETEGKIQSGDFVLGFELKQIDIANVKNGDADFNCVIKIDISSIKAGLTKFPLKYLNNILPDYLYVSSTVYVERGETAFDYTLAHRSMTVNSLDEFTTEDLFRTLNIIAKTGSAKDLNIQIADAVFSCLIGNEQQKGIVYSLKEQGASGFKFVEADEVQYFVVTKSEPVLP